jgi:hypothetical protein
MVEWTQMKTVTSQMKNMRPTSINFRGKCFLAFVRYKLQTDISLEIENTEVSPDIASVSECKRLFEESCDVKNSASDIFKPVSGC